MKTKFDCTQELYNYTMTNIKDRDAILARCRVQYDMAKLYAQYWMTMAHTGAATLRDTAQGRKPTDEEKANGEVIAWTPHTDLEKTQNALNTSMIHIQRLEKLGEVMIALEADDHYRYCEAVKDSL